MTPESTTSLNNFLTDMLAPLQKSFSTRTVLADELRRNTKRTNFMGLQVRVPLMLNLKQGTGGFAQTAGPNAAKQINDSAAFVLMARVGHAIELSIDLIRSSQGNNWAAAGDALKLHMEAASDAVSRVENEMLIGTGDGLLASFTAGATSATQTVGTAANFYQLYPGRVVDVLTRSNGTPVASGSAITINSTAPGSGTVTFSSSITVTTNEGIYIEGTYGNAVQGLQQPFATSGTFEGVNLATTPQFQGVDGRGGVVTAADLSMTLLDGASRRVMAASGKSPDFWIGDPAAIDKFGQSLITQFRWAPKITRLDTGWEGIDYRGAPLIPEFDCPSGVLIGVNKSALTIYGYDQGPAWDEMQGTKFQRFNRFAPVEAWLLDFIQLGIHQPNALVRVANLNQAP